MKSLRGTRLVEREGRTHGVQCILFFKVPEAPGPMKVYSAQEKSRSAHLYHLSHGQCEPNGFIDCFLTQIPGQWRFMEKAPGHEKRKVQ